MKPVFTLLFLIIATASLAQKKQNVYFVKNNGGYVDILDSADFIRVVVEPDSGSILYNVTELYKSNKRKLIGKSSTIESPMFEGAIIEFFETGKRSAVKTYKIGEFIGDQYEYFPNGKPYIIKRYPANTNVVKFNQLIISGESNKNYSIIANYDSLGAALVIDSNGYYKGYDSAFKMINEEGTIKNGKRDGEWKGVSANTTFIETYKDGKFNTGTSTNKLGEIKNYNEREILPKFSKEKDDFAWFLAKKIQYPFWDREKGITGQVILQFVVEKDGSITNIKALRYPTLAMAEESIRVLSSSPKWNPGFQYGFPYRAQLTVPINFSLNQR